MKAKELLAFLFVAAMPFAARAADLVTRLDGSVYRGNDANRAVITNYLSQMEGTRPVSNPAPCSVDVLLVYDKNAANYVRGLGMSLEEHGARGVAVMNSALIPTEIDTNVWFRLVGVYPIDVAAQHVDAAMALAQAGTAPGWDTVHDERDRVGADIVLSVVYTNSNYGLAYRCNPAGIRNGSEAPWAYAGVRADAYWAWAHETGHLASLYHNADEAANTYHDPQYAGCGFVKTARDGTEIRSLMDSGTAQMAFSSPNHLCHGEVYSVTNAAGRWVDSSGVLAELLPYMAKYRETKVPETPTLKISPQSGSSVTKGTKMTVSYGDPEATIWYNRYGEETETQYDGPVLIDTSAAYCIYVVTAKKNGEIVGTEAVAYIVVEKTTATTEYPVPYSWIEACFPGIEGYPDAMYETMAKSPGDNGYKYWESYVLGLDPTNAASRFTATIRMDGDKPVVGFSPTNETLRASGAIEYVLQGRPTLADGWSDCASFDEPGETNRFFRVKVTWTP